MLNGQAFLQGHVEIIHDNVWGTICDNWFNDNSANVICRMAGYGNGVYNYGRYKQTSATKATKIWLSYLVCPGDKTNIIGCTHKPWGQHQCGHHEDVGVRCYGKLLLDII